MSETDSPTSSKKSKKGPGHWSSGLMDSMKDPDLKVDENDKVVIIKDKYPKARFHFLIIPKESIANLKGLTKEHVPLLKHMHDEGEKLAKKSSSKLEFRLGYHAIPSMSQIHLHVISQDFDSTCLKTKKHWNSFTTEYFINSSDLIAMMEEKGSIQFDPAKYSEILKHPLRCHVCKKDSATMPALKTHIRSHFS